MIIGVTGPICSGKDTLGEIFVGKGFERFSLSDEIREEMKNEGIELTRKNMQDYGDKTRMEKGTGAFAREIASKVAKGKNCVIESIRNPGEIEEFKKLEDFVLVMIAAPLEKRFERMVKRGRIGDSTTLEDFKKLELKDLGIGQGSHGQQSAMCLSMADKGIMNDGSLDDLRKKVDKLLEELDL